MRTHIPRVLRAVAQTPWAILPEKLDAIAEFLSLRAAGVGPQLVPDAPPKKAPRTSGGVAVIPVYGVIAQRMDLMAEISGGTSIEGLAAAFERAVADPGIGTIVLDVSSPGGSVKGVDELSGKIAAARSQKRIIAVTDDLMASAAYWLASAAHEIVAAPSADVGSIGVIATHVDQSEADAMEGLAFTTITAGKYKAEGDPHKPLTDTARGAIQAKVDAFYGMFTDRVAKNRGITPAAVKAGYGQGRTMLAADALEAGMIDRIATLEDVLAGLGVSPERQREAKQAGMVAEAEPAEVAALDVVSETAAGEPVAQVATSATAGTHVFNVTINGAGDPAALMEQFRAEVLKQGQSIVGSAATAAESPGQGTGNPGESAPQNPAPKAEEDAVAENTTAPSGAGTQTGGAGAAVHTVDMDRFRAIADLCALHDLSASKVSEFVDSEKSVAEVRKDILAAARAKQAPINAGGAVDMPEKEQRRYSIVRAINAAVSGDWKRAGLEHEVSQAVAKRLGRETNGFFLPTNIKAAGLYTGGATTGQDLVFTEAGSFIDLLRNRALVMQLGATFLPGLQGNVAFPRQIGAGTASWVAENPGSDVSESNLTLDQVTLSPKTLQSTTSYSRQLLAQAVVDVEALVRSDLVTINALAIDKAVVHGGGGSEPTGIYGASGVNSVDFGGSITYAKVVDMESGIAADNADIGVMAFLTTPEVRGAARKTQVFSSTNGEPLWTGGMTDGEMAGYRAAASNQISKTLGSPTDDHGLVFAVWSQVLIGEWGALEIVVDPYSLKKQGMIEVTTLSLTDIALRHGESFCKATTLTPS